MGKTNENDLITRILPDFSLFPDGDMPAWCDTLNKHIELLLLKIYKQPVRFEDFILPYDRELTGDELRNLNQSGIFILFLPTDPERVVDIHERLSLLIDSAYTGAKETGKILIIQSTYLSGMPFFEKSGLYRFYDYDAKNNTSLRLSVSSNPKAVQRYWAKVTDVARDILAFSHKEMHAMEQVKSVYLALTDPDFEWYRDMIERELKRLVTRVLPEKMVAILTPVDRRLIRKEMEQSELIVQIISDFGISRQEGESMVELQHSLAGELNNPPGKDKTIPRLIWIPAEIQSQSKRMKAFITNLQRGGEHMAGAEIIQGPVEVIKSVMRKKLESIRSEPGMDETHDKRPTLYLLNDKQDHDTASKLKEMLEKEKIRVFAPWLQMESESLLQQNKKYLVGCDAIVICYPGGNPVWLSMKMHEILKAPGYGRQHPFVACVLLNNSREEIRNPGIMDLDILQGGDSLRRETLLPLIEKMNERHG